MKHIAFIIHSKIKRIDALLTTLGMVFSGDYTLNFHFTTHEKRSMELAESAIKNGSAYIICVGGDGSLNEVVNGVMKAKEFVKDADIWAKIRIGLLPRGTGNDFAKTIGVTADPALLKKYIDIDSYRAIDLGFAEFFYPNGAPAFRYFINITDIGMGGVVAQKLQNYSKWMGAAIRFQLAIISTLMKYRKQPVKVQSAEFNYEGEIMNLVIANGKYFGNGLGISPDALPGDGLFSVVIIGNISLIDYLKVQADVRKCKKLSHPEIQYRTCGNLSIQTAAGVLPIDMDGDFVGYSPLKLNIVPRAVNFLCAETAGYLK